MKSKIGKKIFLITFLALMILTSLILIFQKRFFESFYIKEKNDTLVKAIDNYRQTYSFKGEDKETIYSTMYEFENNTNAKISIFSLNGKLLYLPENAAPKAIENLFNNIFMELYSNNSYTNKLISSGKIHNTTFYSPELDANIIVVLCPMSIRSQNDSLIISIASVQPIREASNVLSRFLPYFIIGTLFIALFYSMILSRYIANPLIKINKIATKMSNMDFSERYTPTEDNEIDNLGKTLNFLSGNLDSALKELRNKNEILQEEVERERKIEEMRKSFIADVSHELKTPIGIIEGYAEGIRDGIVKDNSQNEYLNIIIDEAHKMNKLVMDMLELSKLQSGNVKPKLEPFNIIRMIQVSLRKYQVLINEKSLSINFNTTLDYLYVEGDTFQIEQVLSNFITNAIKYTPNNNKIFITLEKLNNTILISIENYGVKLPKDELDNIWNKFYKIDKSRVRDKNSSGLGLSITKGILDLHKSSYGIKNTDHGVLAYFTLNLSVDNDLKQT